MKGWIKLHRQIRNHWLWEDPIKFQWWITLLLEVNYTEGKSKLGNQLIKVDRGSSTKAIRTWAGLFECGTKAATSFFDLLESDGMITRKTLGKGKHSTTLINITKYEEYQSAKDSLTDTLTTSLSYTQEIHKRHTIEEEKKIKELKKEKRDRAFHAPSVNEIFNEMTKKGLKAFEAEKEAQGFFNYYESVGWKVGSNKKMEKWKASVNSWISRIPDFKKTSQKIPHNGNIEPTINRQTADVIRSNSENW